MLAFAVVILVITRPWSPKVAWAGAVTTGLQLCALASVAGMEPFGAVLVQSAMDAVTSNPTGVVMGILFFPTEIIGSVPIGIALWRTRWVPRFFPILLWLFPVLDLATPDHPKVLHVIPFAVFLAAFSWLAVLVVRNGAPLPVRREHTS